MERYALLSEHRVATWCDRRIADSKHRLINLTELELELIQLLRAEVYARALRLSKNRKEDSM